MDTERCAFREQSRARTFGTLNEKRKEGQGTGDGGWGARQFTHGKKGGSLKRSILRREGVPCMSESNNEITFILPVRVSQQPR